MCIRSSKLGYCHRDWRNPFYKTARWCNQPMICGARAWVVIVRDRGRTNNDVRAAGAQGVHVNCATPSPNGRCRCAIMWATRILYRHIITKVITINTRVPRHDTPLAQGWRHTDRIRWIASRHQSGLGLHNSRREEGRNSNGTGHRGKRRDIPDASETLIRVA